MMMILVWQERDRTGSDLGYLMYLYLMHLGSLIQPAKGSWPAQWCGPPQRPRPSDPLEPLAGTWLPLWENQRTAACAGATRPRTSTYWQRVANTPPTSCFRSKVLRTDQVFPQQSRNASTWPASGGARPLAVGLRYVPSEHTLMTPSSRVAPPAYRRMGRQGGARQAHESMVELFTEIFWESRW